MSRLKSLAILFIFFTAGIGALFAQKRNITEKDLWDYAKICRVQKVMIPYLEALQ